MDRSNVIYLITKNYEKDEYGILRKTETQKKVFCNVRSVSQSEFFQGGQHGLHPEFKMTMFRHDYSGEETVLYKGRRYAVYRTYETSTDELELYVQKEIGS